MTVDTLQLKSVDIKCFQGCWGPRHENINGVWHSQITHCEVLISVSVMIAWKYKYWFWYCIRNNLAISKYSISNPNQRLSHNSGHNPPTEWLGLMRIMTLLHITVRHQFSLHQTVFILFLTVCMTSDSFIWISSNVSDLRPYFIRTASLFGY